jgi:hypothetical protein
MTSIGLPVESAMEAIPNISGIPVISALNRPRNHGRTKPCATKLPSSVVPKLYNCCVKALEED